MLPSEFPELRRYPKLQRLLARQMDMQIADLRVLLQLPLENLDAGCNFAVASVLFNLIGGCSVCFLDADAERPTRKPRGGDGAFKKLLNLYYPWQDEPVRPSKAIEILYHWARSPLVHALGIDEPQRDNVALAKGPLPIARVLELEGLERRPDWLPPTLDPLEEREGTLFVISVPTLYWGFHRLLHALFADENQGTLSEAFAAKVKLAARSPHHRYRGA
ncbi:MAG: hypothetical protein M3P30_00035 [Chloroflexota bacterium]|nr:hypothetical protein [Chloroflexota bacterium]